MERTVMMPKLGMTMEEGTVLNWRYQEGEWVEKDEALVEVMTDKVNLEVEAPFAGRLHILAQEGEVLPVGAPIAPGRREAGNSSCHAHGCLRSTCPWPVPQRPSARRPSMELICRLSCRLGPSRHWLVLM